MRVRISYGVDIADVPSEAFELASNAVVKLQSLQNKEIKLALDELLEKDANLDLVTEKLDKARKELAIVDSIMSDVQAIVDGLNTYYKGDENVRERRSDLDTTGNMLDEKEETY